MTPTPSPSFETDIVFPTNTRALDGKTIRLIGGASITNLKFDTSSGGTVSFDSEKGSIGDGTTSFADFAVEGDIIKFTSAYSGPDLIRLYLV